MFGVNIYNGRSIWYVYGRLSWYNCQQVNFLHESTREFDIYVRHPLHFALLQQILAPEIHRGKENRRNNVKSDHSFVSVPSDMIVIDKVVKELEFNLFKWNKFENEREFSIYRVFTKFLGNFKMSSRKKRKQRNFSCILICSY